MALNPNIILQGRGVNALGAISEGNQAAAQTNQIQRQNALTGFLRGNGQSVMDGDPAALGQYAALAGPEAALGVQQANLGMDATRQQMQLLESAEARAVAQYVAQAGAAQAAADLAEIESAMKGALPMVIGGDVEAFNQYTSQYGLPPVQSRDQMIAIMSQYDGVRGALKDALGMVAPAPAPLTPEQRAQWGIPESDERPYVLKDGVPAPIGGAGQTINVDTAGDKFSEAFAKGDAATVDAVYNSGLQATRNIARINQLEGLLETAPQGAEGVLKSAAGEFGINSEGLSDIQAAIAIINSLVPEQRQPGSGPMSDADLALFKQSLPRIINQPEGNRQIIATMRAIAQYDAEGAQIVQQLRAGQIDRATAFQMLQSRENPLGNFAPPAPATQPAPAPSGDVSDADLLRMYGGE